MATTQLLVAHKTQSDRKSALAFRMREVQKFIQKIKNNQNKNFEGNLQRYFGKVQSKFRQMADASASLFIQKSANQYESNLRSILENANKYGVFPGQEEKSDQSADKESFAKYLTTCATLTHQRQQIVEKALDLYNRRLRSSTHHLMDNAVLEDRISILEKVDSHLQSIMDNKDYLLDQLNALPSSQATSLPIHISYQESVLETFAELSRWMKNLEANLLNAGMDQCAYEAENDLNDVTQSTETLLASMNTDIRLIKQVQESVHELYQLKMNGEYGALKAFY